MNFDDKIKQVLGKGKKKNVKFSELTMSGVFGKNPVSNVVGKITTKPLTNFKGASPRMQNIWKQMGPVQKSTARKYMKDTDGDRVPNKFDCQPRNVMRQHKPNKVIRNKIKNLPFYHFKNNDSIKNNPDIIYDVAENLDEWKQTDNVQHISDKKFPVEKRKEIYGMIKRHPHLISEIENTENINIVYAENVDKNSITQGFNFPLTQNDKLSGSTIVSFDSSDNKTNMSASAYEKDKNAETIFHELRHNKQNEGLTAQEYAEQRKKGGNSDINTKKYYADPSEIDAREYQFEKMGERLGHEKEQMFRDIDNYKKEQILKYKNNEISYEEAKQNIIEYTQNRYNK